MESKFLLYGAEVAVIEKLKSGYLVADVYEVEETGETVASSSPYVVSEVFDTAPKQKISAEIEALENSRAILKQEIRKLQDQLSRDKAQHTKLIETLSQVPALQHLQDYIDGKLAFIVKMNYYGPELLPFDTQKSEYGGGLKLLSLFGDSNGNLQFKLNRYSDGSGSYDEVYPFQTKIEALEFIQKWINENHTGLNGTVNSNVITAAGKYNLSLPEGILEKYNAEKIANLKARQKEAMANLEGINLQLDTLAV